LEIYLESFIHSIFEAFIAPMILIASAAVNIQADSLLRICDKAQADA
jgi:hypothetical protein